MPLQSLKSLICCVVRVAAEQYLSQTGVDFFSSLGGHLAFIRRNASRGHFHVVIMLKQDTLHMSNIVSVACHWIILYH